MLHFLAILNLDHRLPQMTRPTKPSNTFRANSVMRRLVKGRQLQTMGWGGFRVAKGGGLDFGYIFKLRTWSFEPKVSRQKLVQLKRPGNLLCP